MSKVRICILPIGRDLRSPEQRAEGDAREFQREQALRDAEWERRWRDAVARNPKEQARLRRAAL